MPRIDNSSDTVIDVFDLLFDPSNPGATPPVDLCDECSCSWLDANLFIDHPDYDDDDYVCLECGAYLTGADN